MRLVLIELSILHCNSCVAEWYRLLAIMASIIQIMSRENWCCSLFQWIFQKSSQTMSWWLLKVTTQLSNVQPVLLVPIDQWHGTMLNYEEHRRMSSSTETQLTQSSLTEFQFMLIIRLEITACLFAMFRSTSWGGTSVMVMLASNRICWMFMVSGLCSVTSVWWLFK